MKTAGHNIWNASAALFALALPGHWANAQTAADSSAKSSAPVMRVVGFKEKAFVQVLVSPLIKDDKTDWKQARVDAYQMCPLGYVDAQHSEVRDYPNQRVRSMKFTINTLEGRVIPLPYKAKPDANDMNYWTLAAEKDHGYDQVHLVYTAGHDKTDTLIAEYRGTVISPVFDSAFRNDGKKALVGMAALTPSQREQYLSLETARFKTTKAEMNAALEPLGLIRKDDEAADAYALRLFRWVHANLSYKTSTIENNVIKVLQNKPSGNCNQYALVYGFVLRSQGIPTRIISGRALDSGGHGTCEYLSESTGFWLRMPAPGGGNPNSSFSAALGDPMGMIINELDCGAKALRYTNEGGATKGFMQVGSFFLFIGPKLVHVADVQDDHPDLDHSKVWDITPDDPNWFQIPVEN